MGSPRLPPLSEAQLEIMNGVWDHGEVTVAEVGKVLAGRRSVARNTVQTVLTRLEDKGWLRVDPTAAVSPLRVESGIAASVPSTDALPLLARGQAAWFRNMRFAWDSLANNWNQWVLGYNPDRQFWLLSRVGLDRAR